MSSETEPVACTLTTADAAAHVLEWAELRSHALGATASTNGARIRFPADLEPKIVDLAAREATCCAFLGLATTVADGELVLEVTSPSPDAKPVIEVLAGIPIA